MRVLIADDSVFIRERLQEMLSQQRQAEIVAFVQNGHDALAALRALQPDLAILDIRMPGLTGLEVINEYRKEYDTVKFVVLTFYSSGLFRERAFGAGADYFFSKVDDFEKVAEVVSELIMKQETAFSSVAGGDQPAEPDLEISIKNIIIN